MKMHTGLQPEDESAIRRTAELICGHSEQSAPILEAMLLRLAACPPRSGVTSRKHWLATMQALGEMCLSIAKLEKTREPGI